MTKFILDEPNEDTYNIPCFDKSNKDLAINHPILIYSLETVYPECIGVAQHNSTQIHVYPKILELSDTRFWTDPFIKERIEHYFNVNKVYPENILIWIIDRHYHLANNKIPLGSTTKQLRCAAVGWTLIDPIHATEPTHYPTLSQEIARIIND